MRIRFDPEKSRPLQSNPRRGISFQQASALFNAPYFSDKRSDNPEQHEAIGWVGTRLFTVIYEVREDFEGPFFWLVSLWPATREEEQKYVDDAG